MSYRSHTNESSYTLVNNNVSHGNFLELLCLISKFDDVLRHHLENVINKSKNRLESNSTITKGRGNLITFISKTTVTYIIQILKSLIQEKIVADIKEAGIYSIQIDSTQDVSVKDQLSIIIRYVTDRVEERLLSMVESHSGEGRYLFELTEKTLLLHELDIANCISDSTDGASNMQGQYAGFTTWLENKSPGHIHTWCYAHVLNLVMKDTSETNVPSISLFGLINKCAVFFRESYRRMDTWVNQLEKCHSKQNSLKRLIKANSTR
ncbi:zinc finger MYM-type protein 6-like [Myzus persicae]|uniref:zinc finger MYM-type protein 6-like n=1 Tax=Myzus persicae TaxID=13164 RepID=UPI000B930A37|nr:zinc finger MYM-type protein 6-like [Myzus persicae]